MNLYGEFRRNPGWDGSRIFLRDLRNKREYSYRELDEWTARLAGQLRSRWGVLPGDRVAAQVEKSPQALFLYLACLRAGAVYLPLNTAYLPAEIEYFLGDAEPRLFVCDPSRSREMAPACERSGARSLTLDAGGEGTLLEGIDAQPASFETLERAERDLAAILYTSGTTGRSKGAMLSHGNLASNARALARSWGFGPEDRLLHALPIFHVHGLFISLHCSLMSGSTVHWLPRFEADEVLRELGGATVFMGVPTYYTRLLERPELGRERCAGVRLFVSGSAPLRTETFEEFERRTGHRILERYGMTETGINASNPLEGSRVPGTVGPPLEGVEIRVDRESGVIEVRGPNVFAGYWRQPEKTRDEFLPDGFFRTGDLGEFDSSGYLRIVGRAKDLVISGGFNVYPKEVELVLDRIAGVAESAVFGVPHPDFGEAVVAAVVRAATPEGSELRESALIARARARLAAYKAPKRVVFVDELPRNTMGKVQKTSLRERFARLFG